jgi:hypothetical protein
VRGRTRASGRLTTQWRKFYFRARHDEARLAIGGHDPSDRADWERSEDHPEASYLSAENGLPIIERLVAIYMAKRT